jgi:hypothetical protein
MNFQRLLHSQIGITMISILLGLGLATLFRRVCTDKNCIKFSGPVIKDVDGKVFKYDDKCYKYELQPSKCNPDKKTVEIASVQEKDSEPVSIVPASLQPSTSSFFSFK